MGVLNNEHVSDDLNKTIFDGKLPELKEFPDDIDTYEKLHKFSVENSELFWGTLARRRIEWYEEFHEVCNFKDFNAKDFNLKWFSGGKLNVSGK